MKAKINFDELSELFAEYFEDDGSHDRTLQEKIENYLSESLSTQLAEKEKVIDGLRTQKGCLDPPNCSFNAENLDTIRCLTFQLHQSLEQGKQLARHLEDVINTTIDSTAYSYYQKILREYAESEPEYELQFCEKCNQMTNHIKNECQKCKRAT